MNETQEQWRKRVAKADDNFVLRRKADYFCRLEGFEWGKKKFSHAWMWEIVTNNGHVIQTSKLYGNKAHCRNVGRKFARAADLEWRE